MKDETLCDVGYCTAAQRVAELKAAGLAEMRFGNYNRHLVRSILAIVYYVGL
jgi:hypothetical protein